MKLSLRLPTPARLLLQWDGFTLHAALLRQGTVQERTRCQAVSLAEALSQLPPALLATRRCVLAAAEALPLVLDLPVDPDQPRAPRDMDAMVRWEIEPFVGEAQQQWTLGAILCAQGQLNAEQRYAAQLELELMAQRGQTAPLRFGEIALAMGAIGRDGLKRALAQQEVLRELGEQQLIGYTGERLADGSAVWRVSVLPHARRQQWLAALASHKLQLEALLPLETLAPAHGDGRRIALEIHAESLTATLWQGRQLAGLRREYRAGRSNGDWIGDMVADWALADRGELTLYWQQAPDAALQEQLLARCGGEVRCASDGEEALARLREQALQAWLGGERHGVVALPLRERWQLDWKSPALQRWAAFAAANLLLLGWVGNAALARHHAEQQRISYQQQRKQESDARSGEQQLSAETQKVFTEVERLRSELAGSMAVLQRVGALDERVRLVPELIRRIGEVIGDEVVLDVLSEAPRQGGGELGIQVEAWSLSQDAAQAFARAVNQAVNGDGLVVAQSEVVAAKGRGGEGGYRIRFWLVPQLEQGSDMENER